MKKQSAGNAGGRSLPSIVALVAFAILVSIALGTWRALRYGFSARDEPMIVEEWAARVARALAIPVGARELTNPVVANEAVLAGARRHFADHCASCHANDGSGSTRLGRSLYPKAPDMRRRPTQDQSDGELFYIIRNGVRLTGMPAWSEGPAESDTETWGLVHLLRRLDQLSAEEIREMEAWNPTSRAEALQADKIASFLAGVALPLPDEPAP